MIAGLLLVLAGVLLSGVGYALGSSPWLEQFGGEPRRYALRWWRDWALVTLTVILEMSALLLVGYGLVRMLLAIVS